MANTINYLNQTKIIIHTNNGIEAQIGDRLVKNDISEVSSENPYSLVGNGSIGVNLNKNIDNVDLPNSRTFSPNDNNSRFFIGTNIWDDNNWDNSIRANVDSQDDFLSDDLDTSNLSMSNLGKAAGNSVKNLVTNKIGVVKDVKKLVGRLTGGEANPEVPSGTVYDTKFNYLKALKSEKYRNVKINAVVGGTYNSLSNLLGFASGMMVGSLGKSSLSSEIDGLTSKFTGGLGIAGMLENVSGAIEAMPTVEEIAALNLARFNTMYEAKPGRIVRDRFNRYNFITPNTTDGIDGTINTSGKETILNKILGKVNGVASKVTSAMNTASSWLNGSKFTEFIASKDLSGTNRIGGDQIGTDGDLKAYTIITQQRDGNFSQYVGSIGSVDNTILKKGANGKQSLRIGLNITDWTGQNYGGKYGILGTNPDITDLVGLGNGNYGEGWTRNDVFSRINSAYRKIGCLYIEPYYNDGNINCFQIPLEFNPTISDGGYEAKYQTQELLGRILSVRSYIGTDSQTVTLETKYIAMAPSESSVNQVINDKDQYIAYSWMREWTVDQIERVEQLYRSLVMPYIDVSYGTFVRPPIIRIKLHGYDSGQINSFKLNENGEEVETTEELFSSGDNSEMEYVGDLFKYPASTFKNNNLLYVSNNLEGKKTREKRYIATALQINPLEDESLSYSSFTNVREYAWRRYGFSVNLTLAETTRNFLDIPPSFCEYYKAEKDVSKTNNSNNYVYTGSEEVAPDLGEFNLHKSEEALVDFKIPESFFDADVATPENNYADVASIFGEGKKNLDSDMLADMYKYADYQGKELS